MEMKYQLLPLFFIILPSIFIQVIFPYLFPYYFTFFHGRAVFWIIDSLNSVGEMPSSSKADIPKVTQTRAERVARSVA